jgi:hypothetical protein
VDAEIGTAIRDGSSLYTLTYRPSSPVTDLDTFRRIKAKELRREAKMVQSLAPASAPPRGRIELPVGFDYQLPPDPKAVRARLVVRVEASGRMGH